MSEVAEKIAEGLQKISQAIRTNEWDCAFKEELTPTQAEILSTLHGNGKGSQVKVKDVAAKLGVTMPTAVDSINALCRKGFIKKTKSEEDKRARLLALSPKGRNAAKGISNWTQFLQDAIDELDSPEQSSMLKGLIKIVLQLQQQKKISVANMCITCKYFQAFAHKKSTNPHHCHYVNLPFGDENLRIFCPDHEDAENDDEEHRWLAHG